MGVWEFVFEVFGVYDLLCVKLTRQLLLKPNHKQGISRCKVMSDRHAKALLPGPKPNKTTSSIGKNQLNDPASPKTASTKPTPTWKQVSAVFISRLRSCYYTLHLLTAVLPLFPPAPIGEFAMISANTCWASEAPIGNQGS